MDEKPNMSMLGPCNHPSTTSGICPVCNPSGTLFRAAMDNDKLHANGAAIEPGPAVGRQRCPRCGGADLRAIWQSSSYDYNCKTCGCFFSTTTGLVDFPIGDSRCSNTEENPEGIDWEGTSLVPSYDLPDTETLFRALEHRFKAQAAELRAAANRCWKCPDRERAEQAERQRDEAREALRDLDSRKFDDANNMIHVDVPHNKPTEVWLDWEPVRRFIAAALERLEVKDE